MNGALLRSSNLLSTFFQNGRLALLSRYSSRRSIRRSPTTLLTMPQRMLPCESRMIVQPP